MSTYNRVSVWCTRFFRRVVGVEKRLHSCIYFTYIQYIWTVHTFMRCVRLKVLRACARAFVCVYLWVRVRKRVYECEFVSPPKHNRISRAAADLLKQLRWRWWRHARTSAAAAAMLPTVDRRRRLKGARVSRRRRAERQQHPWRGAGAPPPLPPPLVHPMFIVVGARTVVCRPTLCFHVRCRSTDDCRVQPRNII